MLTVGAGLLGSVIFLVDTFSSREFAVAVLYVIVVVIATRYGQRRIVWAAAITCTILTLVSFAVMHQLMGSSTSLLRVAVSLSAIAITTGMALETLDLDTRLTTTRRERTSLARFLPQQMIGAILDSEAPLTIARRGPAAILFADMIGFTSRTTGLGPHDVMALVRQLTKLYGTAITAHHGTIDKFLGDGVLASFGLPTQGRNEASEAVQCAFDMLKAANRLNAIDPKEPIALAIGIHYGEVIQGDIGSDGRLELTVVGEVVNVASRIEGLCRWLDASIIVTEAVMETLHAEGRPDLAARFEDLGLQPLRGHAALLRVYGVKDAG